MTAPVVGITLRPQDGSSDRPPRLVQNRAYLDAIEAVGAIPLPIPLLRNTESVRALYERCDAVCLPGGPDVDPHLYDEEIRAGCGVEPSAELDDVEMQLTRWLLADDRPLLAVCRGVQVLNVALGGTLWQDLRTQAATTLTHRQHSRTALAHSVRIEPDSLLHRIVGVDVLEVNSLHHQGIHRVGEGLQVSGRAGDGLVEAVEMPDRRFLLGVQWHPEELVAEQEASRRLFAALVSAAR